MEWSRTRPRGSEAASGGCGQGTGGSQRGVRMARPMMGLQGDAQTRRLESEEHGWGRERGTAANNGVSGRGVKRRGVHGINVVTCKAFSQGKKSPVV